MQISSLARTLQMQEQVTDIKTRMDDLSRQLVTGKKADTIGGLGSEAALALSLNDQITSMTGYIKTIELVNLRLGVQSEAVTRMDDIASKIKTDSLTTSFKLTGAGQTQLQLNAGSQFDEIVSLLNTELEGRHLFAGSDTGNAPVALPDAILNGDSTRAGLKTVIAERAQADLGADGRGRLTLNTVGSTFTVAEDAAPSVFGAKLKGATSNLTGTTVTGPAGSPPDIDVAFSATLPKQGEVITFEMNMPDGTVETIELTATQTAPAKDGEFLVGADENATAANFQAAFDAELQTFAKTKLSAASASQATNDFFDSNPPKRVSGAPLTSATALVDGTENNTVFWYTGDTSSNAPALAKVSDNEVISYGVRADDNAIVDLLKSTALLASTTYTGSDPDETAHYAELTERVANTVAFTNKRAPLDVVMEMGFQQSKLDAAKESMSASRTVSQKLLDKTENADDFEVAAQLSVIQTQLQAAYQVTAKINEFSLLNYLR